MSYKWDCHEAVLHLKELNANGREQIPETSNTIYFLYLLPETKMDLVCMHQAATI